MTTPDLGTFAWRELMTPDIRASKRFYGELFGWKTRTAPMGDASYELMENGPASEPVGGMMQLPGKGPPPCWMSQVTVEDVDAAAKAVALGGGKMIVAPQDIPGVGRFGVALDPQGAAITLFRGEKPAEAPARERPGEGEFCWEHLTTTDPDAAAAFYEKLLGWSRQAVPGDDDGAVFVRGGKPVASMRRALPGVPAHWTTHVGVRDVGGACERVRRLGGKVLLPPTPLPGIGTVAVIQDDVGAVLGVFEASTGAPATEGVLG